MFYSKVRKKTLAILLTLVFLATFVTPVVAAESTGEIYYGGTIVTVDESKPTADAVAVKDGKIVGLGTLDEMKAQLGGSPTLKNLKGNTLIPGFYDAHSHFKATGTSKITRADLAAPPIGQVETIEKMIETLKAWDAAHPNNEWIVGSGYDDGQMTDGRHPTAADLDLVSTEKPVMIVHFSGHNSVVNHKALELAGITKTTADPEGGQFGKDASGELNGQLWETAMYPVGRLVPALTPEEQLQTLKAAADLYAANGYTTVNEGAGGNGEFDLYMQAIEQGLVKQHVNFWFMDWNKAKELYAQYPTGTESVHYAGKNNLLQLTGVKMFHDGSPQLRTAFMTDPYFTTGEYPADWVAYARTSRAKLTENVVAAHQAGINQIYIHGNGDAAIDDIIAAYQEVHQGAANGTLRTPANADDMRHVVIHSQFTREDQLDAMRDNHIIPSFLIMHPYFLGNRHWDMYFGPERAARMSATGDAANRDIRFSLHCDAPVFPTDNLLMLQTAVERKSYTGRGIFTETYDASHKYRSIDQRITPLEALKALTLDAAYGNGEENVVGSITVGKRADLVVLSANPLTVPSNTIKDIKVLETIVDGQSIYKASSTGGTSTDEDDHDVSTGGSSGGSGGGGASTTPNTPKKEEPKETTPAPATVDFEDIDQHWAKADIEKAVKASFFGGMSDKLFAPDTPTTRAMVVAVLHRISGNTAPTKEVSFTDVAKSDWFANDVAWAIEKAVAKGMGDGRFAPNEAITREQLAAILANYDRLLGNKQTYNKKALDAFADKPSDWAVESMSWAVDMKLIGGMDNQKLDPKGKATRAQFAVILNRYASLIKPAV